MAFTIRLSGAQTISEAETTAQLLRDSLAEHDSILLDCDEIDAADLTFLQLIMAARKSAGRDGKSIALTASATGTLLAALDSAGIRPEGEHGFWFEGGGAR